ncbi:MAG: type II secretion system F family protein [bacterium]
MSTLLDAGVPVLSCLNLMAQQSEDSEFKRVLERIVKDVNAGVTLSIAFAKFPDIFSSLFLAMVRMAEEVGNLAQVLNQLSIYLKEQDQLKKKIKAAITYPRFVLGFFLLVLLAIIFGLIPKFKEIFESFDAELPVPTQMLLNVSNFAKDHLFAELLLLAGVVFLFKQYQKSPSGRYFLDRMKLSLPVVGELFSKSALAKFCRTLSVLLQSGVSFVESLEIAGDTTQNVLFQDALREVKQGIIEGTSLKQQLSKYPVFPPLMVKMVSVGEESGSLDKMLSKISEMYDAHVDSKISGLSSIIEPALMIGLGAVALVVIIALYLPIFKMSTVIH